MVSSLSSISSWLPNWKPASSNEASHNDWTPPEIFKEIDVEELSVQGDSGIKGVMS